MDKKLGKRPARPGAVTMRFSTYFNRDELPKPPPVFGHERIGTPWQVLGNDQWGNCVWAGAAHEHMVWTHEGGVTSQFDDKGVISDYSAATGFDPRRPDTDQGSDMSDAASYRRTKGVVDADGTRHKIDSYLALKPGNVEDVALATYLTGACGLGVMMPASSMDQFDQGKPWSPVPGSPIEGGHYIPCIGRNRHGHLIVITWGRVHAMTPEFYATHCDEALAYISLEAIRAKTKATPEGFDLDALRKHINALRK